jgi:hypothetical protein
MEFLNGIEHFNVLSVLFGVAATLTIRRLTRGLETLTKLRRLVERLGDEAIQWVELYCGLCRRLKAARKGKAKGEERSVSGLR